MTISRRDVLGGTAGFAMTTELAAQPLAGSERPPIVLVHGAGHGGWCWKMVREQLLADGFSVFTPTLTGLGERVHLRSPSLSLETHILDVENLIRWEELDNVILVGHSYAGMVITGVCDRLKSRIAHVIYLDAALPKNGQAAFPDLTREIVEERSGPLVEGYLMTVNNLAALGVANEGPEIRAWMQRRLTEHPLQLMTEPITLVNGGSEGVARTFILCADPDRLPPRISKKISALKDDPSWRYVEKVGPHNVMITDPLWTAALIADTAASPTRGLRQEM